MAKLLRSFKNFTNNHGSIIEIFSLDEVNNLKQSILIDRGTFFEQAKCVPTQIELVN